MAIFKCKMCGGALEVTADKTVLVCEYCGTQQTLPRLDDEKRANLYDRANHFRRNNEFDKAMAIYEQILTEDGTDAEAYWSLVLCRYGIEYVEDPATHKRVPTVNRAQFTSIFDDDNYRSALENADALQKTVYEAEAKAINEIQKGILAISQKEAPFDVFICYKESDANGRRTQDSVLANDLYHQLTQEGFKVFFSRITLEDKLGVAYEPYIFAALNSAKVMVVLGTRPEYFNAVWVKNEWSRYLALVKASGGKKLLIPAYKDMDPYDLPEEFSHLQAQDMSKLGFMQDLIRGIKKIITTTAAPAKERETVVVNNAGGVNIAPLLRRVSIFLEDGEWADADAYCEKVLDIDPESAEAYLGKLMAELQVENRQALADCPQPFEESDNYRKALRFADEKFKKELEGYVIAKKTAVYEDAMRQMQAAQTEVEFLTAAARFETISDFKDAAALVRKCREFVEEIVRKEEEARKAAKYEDAMRRMQAAQNEREFLLAAERFEQISDFEDAAAQAEKCRESAERSKKTAWYEDAMRQMRVAKTEKEFLSAAEQFAALSDYEDAVALEAECREKAKVCRVATKKRLRMIALITSGATALFVLLCIFVINPFSKKANGDYSTYINLYNVKEFEIPEGTTEIKAGAFSGCTSLTSVTIPPSVKGIDTNTFADCTSIETATMPATVISAIPKDKLKTVVINGGERIGKNAFSGCTSLVSITLPSTVTSIGASAFYNCTSLVSITLPPTVMSIGASAFRNCTNLTSITIPASVTSIGEGAFSGCSGLESITLPFVGGCRKTASDPYQYPFGYIFGTSSYAGGVQTTQKYYGSSISSTTSTTYYIPESLKSVIITGGEILRGAFLGCTSLTSITIPLSVTRIGGYAFYNCANLASITIPASVTSIGNYAFWYCTSLASIEISSSVTSVGEYAFYQCASLTGVYITDTAKWCGIAFDDYYANPLYYAKNLYLNGTLVTELVIPEGVTSIGSRAFSNCTSFVSITIPSSVKSIDVNAFAGCTSIETATIPATVIPAIPEDKLKTVVINGGKSISERAFAGCTSLASITIPASVTSISERAFAGCTSLTSIMIPPSVTSIGASAFV